MVDGHGFPQKTQAPASNHLPALQASDCAEIRSPQAQSDHKMGKDSRYCLVECAAQEEDAVDVYHGPRHHMAYHQELGVGYSRRPEVCPRRARKNADEGVLDAEGRYGRNCDVVGSHQVS